MNLFSLEFVTLLIVLLLAFYLLPKRFQWICLLAASILFYAFSGPINLLFIGITSFSTWGAGVLFSRFRQEYERLRKEGSPDKEQRKVLKAQYARRKRILMWAVVVLNFGILTFVKYIPAFSTLGLLFPLGISFYTFQAIGYLMDQYNEKYEPEQNYLRYLLFIAFFPQLIQGPINRFDKLKESLLSEHSFRWEQIKRALFMILFGLMKKYAIANLLAGAIAYILDAPTAATTGSSIVMAILMYSAQQYADFSGGIDLVLGIALLFGVEMMPNFRQPYFAVSLADFWRRWHISLGAWMKDYVFFPFALTKPMQKFGKWGNNKFGREIGRVLPGSIGNILVFFLVGIWHGARMHYIVWGLYNGVIISLTELIPPIFHALKPRKEVVSEEIPPSAFRQRCRYVLSIVITFVIVNIGWYFDRIEKMSDCMLCFRNTVMNFNPSSIPALLSEMSLQIDSFSFAGLGIVGFATLLVLVHSIMSERHIDVFDFLQRHNIVIRWGVYYLLLILIQVSMSMANGSEAFIYAVF